MKKTRKILLLIGCVMFLHSLHVAAGEWFVRPAGGSYGKEDGTSYENAWDGLLNVVWGGAGVVAGDTLYVCGLHLHTTNPPNQAARSWIIDANGTSENRITIRGDYSGDQGIIWGAQVLSSEWSNEGDNVYSTTLTNNCMSYFFFEDVTATSWTLLTRASSVQECKDTSGSYYSATYASTGSLYVHCSDNGDPTDRIAANYNGWNIWLSNRQYITFKNIEFYEPNFRGKETPVSYITWEGCKLWYASSGITISDKWHHIEFIDCDRAYGNGGFNLRDEVPVGTDAPHHITFSNCVIHDIGVYRKNTDSEGIGVNGAITYTIEYCEFYNCGTAISLFCYNGQESTDVIIRWNYVHDMRQVTNEGRGYGLEMTMQGENTEDKSGCEIYGNIFADIPRAGFSSTWPTDNIVFYNNVAYNCRESFWFQPSASPDSGPNITLRNNISMNPILRHLYFASGTTEGNYTIDYNYNLFYPADQEDSFFFSESVGGQPTALYTELAGWQALSKTGCTFDPNSIAGDPLFIDPENGNFNLWNNSPAIDAGVDVGLIQDFEGNPVPQGNAPDIGACEYIVKSDEPDPDPEPEIIPEETQIPHVTALRVSNNIIKQPENTSVTIQCFMKEADTLTVKIYDTGGEEIITLCHEHRNAGIHTFNWEGKDADANKVGSGIYIVHMEAGDYKETKKIAVVK